MMKDPHRIPGVRAWDTITNPKLRWENNLSRFSEAVFPVAHKPKFHLSSDERFFCIGSCFARNVEEHLIFNGLKVLSRRISIPKTEWSGRPNGITNKFTSASILNEIEWLDHSAKFGAEFFVEGSGGWLDLQLSPGARPVTLARAIERRRYMTEEYFARIHQADVIVITLGLDEVWVDQRSGLRLNGPPPPPTVRQNPAQYVVEITNYEQNLQALEAMHRKLGDLRPGLRYVITVSPVAMDVSFSGLDPAIATTRAKSLLRTVAQHFADAHDDVDYFPSYEMVNFSARSVAYAQDCRHVTDRAVSAVIGYFIESYLKRASSSPVGFTELGYLEANPDVDEAVRSGALESGFEHWIAHGRREGRRLTPESGPTPLMVRAGAVGPPQANSEDA
jgi:hypothetical protein